MGQRFRFAIVSDPHIALPDTIPDHPHRFHLVEVSIPGLEQILAHLETLDLDFLLLPGDLTQNGEWANHHWLIQRLKQLPFPAYVVPGNHDMIARDGTAHTIGLADFPRLYHGFGYDGPAPYYHQEILSGVHLIGLNSNAFDGQGHQRGVGHVGEEQLAWLRDLLPQLQDDLVLVMLHHNVLEHLWGQAQSPLGQRYMVENRQALIQILNAAQVPLLFTGHLHVQDIARQGSLCEVLTGSLVSYPHPYRVLEAEWERGGSLRLAVQSHRLEAVAGWDNLQTRSYEWMCDRARVFMAKFLAAPPINLSPAEAEVLAPRLSHFWPTIANGDPQFDFAHLPPAVQPILNRFNAVDGNGQPETIDNATTLLWPSRVACPVAG